LSDKDRDFLVDMGPGTGRTPLGNKLIIDYNRRLAERSLEVERERVKYLAKNKGRLDEGFYTHLTERFKDDHLFSEKDSKDMEAAQIKRAKRSTTTTAPATSAPSATAKPPSFPGTDAEWKQVPPEEHGLWK
jgi:hypothetical protein